MALMMPRAVCPWTVRETPRVRQAREAGTPHARKVRQENLPILGRKPEGGRFSLSREASRMRAGKLRLFRVAKPSCGQVVLGCIKKSRVVFQIDSKIING